MGIDLAVVLWGEAAEEQYSPVACSLLNLVKGTLRHTRNFINAPRATHY